MTDETPDAAPRKRTRAKKPKGTDQDDPTIPDNELPNPVSLGGSVQVTGFSNATPAEAAAASHFQGFK